MFAYRHVLVIGIFFALWALPGCDRKSASPPYQVLEGVVAERHSDTGELGVRLAPNRRGEAEGRVVFCIVTKNTEVYIDDVLSRPDAVNVGDAIELVCQRDPNSRLERFVVSFAHVRPVRERSLTTSRAAAPAADAPTAKEP